LSSQAKIAINSLSELKMGIPLIRQGRRSSILELPGANFLLRFRYESRAAVFLVGSRNQEFCGFSGGHSKSLTMSPPFLFFQGKEMMLFPASPFVFLD
jgi:hypothetical protein